MSKASLMTCIYMVMSVAQAVAQTQTFPRLALELTDGTQLLGAAAVEGVKVHAPGSAIQLTLKDIAHIQFRAEHEHDARAKRGQVQFLGLDNDRALRAASTR